MTLTKIEHKLICKSLEEIMERLNFDIKHPSYCIAKVLWRSFLDIKICDEIDPSGNKMLSIDVEKIIEQGKEG